MTKISVQSWTKNALNMLQGNSEFPYIETQVLLSFVLQQKREWLITHPDTLLSTEQEAQLDGFLKRLRAGEPLPYLTGIQAFYGLDFNVSPAVLIPRPETELLVEEAIQWLEAHPGKHSALDVGTGSGAIAITLADQIADLRMLAVDNSLPALDIARSNAAKFNVQDRVNFAHSNLFSEISAKFDLVTANLPYIPSGTLQELEVRKYEPIQALDGGLDGLKYISEFLAQSTSHVKRGSLLVLEIEAGQGESVQALAKEAFPTANVTMIRDFSQHPRIIKIQA